MRNFDLADVAPFKRAVELLKPGASGRDAAALLDNRISREVAQHWLAGRRHTDPWALHALAAMLRNRAILQIEFAAELEAIRSRPGKQAGARNLAIWRAAQNR